MEPMVTRRGAIDMQVCVPDIGKSAPADAGNFNAELGAKWCCGPPAIVSGQAPSSLWPAQARSGPLKCIASECMAWRWAEPTNYKLRNTAGDEWIGPRPKSEEGFALIEELPRRGFCGLAGQPQ